MDNLSVHGVVVVVGELAPAFVQRAEETVINGVLDRPVIIVDKHIHLGIAFDSVIVVVIPYKVADVRCHTHRFPRESGVRTGQHAFDLLTLVYCSIWTWRSERIPQVVSPSALKDEGLLFAWQNIPICI